METGSVISEPVTEKSTSMTILSTSTSPGRPRMAQLETLEAKMASIEVSLSSSTPRRRKGTSLGGTITSRISPKAESKEIRTALQDREAIIQDLRVQLGLEKLPRPTGAPLDDSERPAAEQRLSRLKNDAENKQIAIRNLKLAIDKLDVTGNIDMRIRRAELEYALGREELQLLSTVEEVRALQARLDKSKPEANTMFNLLQSGVHLCLYAVQVNVGRWNVTVKEDFGVWIDWAMDGENVLRGDRIIEVNGKTSLPKTKDEFQKLIGTSDKCQLVVVRKRNSPYPQQQLIQTQEDNQRLQHRISYLEEQVKELQSTKETNGHAHVNGNSGTHVTSISISSPPNTPPERPQVFQRGNFVTTIVGGKPVDHPPSMTSLKSHVTKTIIKESQLNGHRSDGETIISSRYNNSSMLPKSMSASKISINSDITNQLIKRERKRESTRDERERYYARLANGNGERSIRYSEGSAHYNSYNKHAKSVEYLNHNSIDRRKEMLIDEKVRRMGHDLRSVKSLDFESDTGEKSSKEVDYTSEPNGPRTRPTPPKKPLRLSLQRAQSLQTVEAVLLDSDKKRAMKRTYKGDKTLMENYILESGIPFHTTSLGRSKFA